MDKATREKVETWKLFQQLQTQLLESMEQEFAKNGLVAYRSYDVLVALLHAPQHRLRLSELAREVSLSRSGLTRMVDRLEREGYLRRSRSSDDGRGVYAELSETGSKAVQQAWPTYKSGLERFFADRLSASERQTLRSMCLRLLGLMPEAAPEEEPEWL